MRTKKMISVVVALSVILTCSLAFAGWSGWGMGSHYNRMYKPATVETITGTVESVDKVRPMKGMYYGINFLQAVKTLRR